MHLLLLLLNLMMQEYDDYDDYYSMMMIFRDLSSFLSITFCSFPDDVADVMMMVMNLPMMKNLIFSIVAMMSMMQSQ